MGIGEIQHYFIGFIIGFNSFKKEYGERLDNGNYDIPASWQTVLTMMNNVGKILGIMIDGWSIEIGMVIKKVMHIAFFYCCVYIHSCFRTQ